MTMPDAPQPAQPVPNPFAQAASPQAAPVMQTTPWYPDQPPAPVAVPQPVAAQAAAPPPVQNPFAPPPPPEAVAPDAQKAWGAPLGVGTLVAMSEDSPYDGSAVRAGVVLFAIPGDQTTGQGPKVIVGWLADLSHPVDTLDLTVVPAGS